MNGTSKKGVNIMAFLYFIITLLDLVVCILFIVQATLVTTGFRVGISIYCAICWGICFILNLFMAIDNFRKKKE